MKNVEIAEGGIGRRLSGTKFVLTDKPESDQMEVWVDEDDRKLARLYATNNGTYYPEDYDAYGFSSVTVSIHGGVANPDLPNIELPDGTIVPALIPEIEMPDGTLKPIDELFPEIAEDPLTDIGEVKVPDTVGEEGSSITGIDPEDGYTYKVEVDENGNLDIEKVPTDIRVVDGSLKGEYEFGDTIDPTGLVAELVDKDGNVVKTKEYPDGTIKYSGDGGELEVPETDTTKLEDQEWGGKKNDKICNANTITYAKSGFTMRDSHGHLVYRDTYVSGTVGTYNGKSVMFGSGVGTGRFLVTGYQGHVWFMRLSGTSYVDLYTNYDLEDYFGDALAASTNPLSFTYRWEQTAWETSDIHVPESTILLSYDEMRPTKFWLRTNWDDPYNGRRVESKYGVYYIDPITF